MEDASDRNRQVTRNSFTEEQVLQIRAWAEEKDQYGRRVHTAADIQRAFCERGVPCGLETIRRIIRGQTWAFLTKRVAMSRVIPDGQWKASLAKVLSNLAEVDKPLTEEQIKWKAQEEEVRKRAREMYGSLPKRQADLVSEASQEKTAGDEPPVDEDEVMRLAARYGPPKRD